MSNRNLKYQNGLRKRDAVRAVRAWMRTAGCLETRDPALVAARVDGRPAYALDTNVMFATLEYWAAELRHGLRELAMAQPELRIYLIDVVASECRGSREKQRLYDEIVFNGRNAGEAVIYPLRGQTAEVGRIASDILRRFPPARPSDIKDAHIAATTLAHDLILVTVNESDFAPLRAAYPKLRLLVLRGEGVERHIGELLLRGLAEPFGR